MDKEYILLNEIEKNENITQRELSKKTELSLGSVNILLNKMVHEGLIKIKQVPMKRVAYMLTPSGIAEKVMKTSGYIKIHYNYIYETTKKIKNIIIDLSEKYERLFILLEQDEISELVRQAVNEIHDSQHIRIISKDFADNLSKEANNFYIAVSIETYKETLSKGAKVLNILELL